MAALRQLLVVKFAHLRIPYGSACRMMCCTTVPDVTSLDRVLHYFIARRRAPLQRNNVMYVLLSPSAFLKRNQSPRVQLRQLLPKRWDPNAPKSFHSTLKSAFLPQSSSPGLSSLRHGLEFCTHQHRARRPCKEPKTLLFVPKRALLRRIPKWAIAPCQK